MEKPKAIICDLDGTLCDSSWRKHFVEGEQKNWKAFYAGISADPPRYDVLRLLLKEWSERGAAVVFVTGRSDEHKGATAEWIIRQLPAFRSAGMLWMRDAGDHRPDVEVKRELIWDVMKNYDVVLAFEDRPHIVEMIREMGIECVDVGEK